MSSIISGLGRTHDGLNSARRRRIKLALITIAALGAIGATPAQAAPSFQAPFPCGQQIRMNSWGSDHAPALDIFRVPQSLTEGNPVVSPAPGIVNQSFYHSNAGNVIQIDHGGGWFTTYLHLQSRAVGVGARVAQGTLIAHVGHTGPTSNGTPHLHFEMAIDRNGDGQAEWGYVNPERVPPVFNGITYGQRTGGEWTITSTNCGASSPADQDEDGVPDSTDRCPTQSGVATFAGCPEELFEIQPASKVDFNGDSRADYCRRVGQGAQSYVSCTLGTDSGFGATVQSGVLDWGYDTGRAWVDFNGDGKADYCRRVGDANLSSSHVSCTLSTGSGFGATVQSGVLDWGYDTGRAWVGTTTPLS
jgi:hypothetical protein